MAEAAERDASDPAVISLAQQFMVLPTEQRAAKILRCCQLALRYQRDPAWHDRAGNRHGIEVLDSSAVLLFRGYGDCDAKTRLFLALCKVCGVPARLAPVFRGTDGFPHVRAEVLDARTGTWLIADPSIVNSTIGYLPPHNRTHILQRRLTARGWEVSDDDGTTWHPMEGGGEAGDGEAAPGDGGPARGASGGPAAGPYLPGAIVYIGGNWYKIDPTGRATPEGIVADPPPPPPPDQIATQQAAARRVRHMPPPRRRRRRSSLPWGRGSAR
jgi:hypothetical protein